MAYSVTAPLVIAKNAEGGDLYLYQDALVPDGQSDEWVKAHLESKMIAKVDAPPPSDDDTSGDQPAKSASKGEWVSYAVSQGADQDDAEAMTKEQLVGQFGD